MEDHVFRTLHTDHNYFERSSSVIYASDDVKRRVWTICSPIILVIGTIGNILSILVFARKGMRNLTSALYLIVLAIADLLLLYLGLLRYYIRELTDVDIRDTSETACKLHIIFVYFMRHFTSWILVSVTVERFISVWYPFKAKIICTLRNGAIVLAALGLVLFSANLHSLWTMELVSTSNTTDSYECRTVKHKGLRFFDFKIWPWIDSFIASYCPFAIMLVFNILIIVRITRPQRYKTDTSGNSPKNIKLTSLTAMLLTVNLAFLVLTTPGTLYFIGQHTWWKEEKRKYPERFEIFWAVSNLLLYVNSAINFPLYCISGPRFRRELAGMFLSPACHNRVGTVSDNVS